MSAARLTALREGIRQPLSLAYHPLYRFYEGGSLTRRFRGLPERPDDWWSEDWVGSCTCANNAGPDGRAQGLSAVELPGVGTVTLQEIIEALPEEMVGATFAGSWGPITGVLVKLLSPAGQVPLHAHPTREWARKHLGSRFGKTEAWILLDTPGDGTEPAYAGIGFLPGIDRDWFAGAVRRHDNSGLRGTLHRTDVHPGEVYVAHAGVPHYLGPRISFIEVQEPSDHIVIPETSGAGEAGATMGLGWDLALDMIDYSAADGAATFARARQLPRALRSSHGSREVRLFHDDVLRFFDATALEVADEIEVSDGRFSIAIVVSGAGFIEGDFGRRPIGRGETFALPASLPFRVRAGPEPVRVVRCLGPSVELPAPCQVTPRRYPMLDSAVVLREAYDRVRHEYGDAIGQRRDELVTPALVLDIDAAQRNIDRMASELKQLGRATIRPHYKTHKSPDLARRQLKAGAGGLSMATVWEAAVLAAAGMDDLFVVNTVAHPAKLRTLAELARDHRILVAVDEAANAAAHSAAAVAAGSTLGIMVEVDTGMDRCGVDTAEECLALARRVMELPGLWFEGITGYEGHCSLTPDSELRHERQREAMAFFTGVADLLETHGIPCKIRSAGGIATWRWTAGYPGMTEIQAGTYVVMDNFHGRMVPGFEHSLTIQATVISRQSGKVIVDAGNKSVADPADVTIVGHDLTVFRFDEEHGIFAAGDGSSLVVGDAVALVPGYSPSTVNWYDAYHVVHDGVVVDIWPIIPRGPGHHGLARSPGPAR